MKLYFKAISLGLKSAENLSTVEVTNQVGSLYASSRCCKAIPIGVGFKIAKETRK
jgi:hypothetical protein